jgi:hypothetical protein
VREKIKETDLYLPVKKYFEEQGFEVFPEVQLWGGGDIIDVLAINEKFVFTIEMKVSFSLKVIEQAVRHLYKGHRHYVAIYFHNSKIDKDTNRYVPRSDHDFAMRICEHYGIGVLRIKDPTGEYPKVEETMPAKFIRPFKEDLKTIYSQCDKFRKEYQQKHSIIAGANGGGHLTGYKRTMLNVINYLLTKGIEGATAREITANIDHHYSGYTPQAFLSQAFEKWEQHRIGRREQNNKRFYYLLEFKKLQEQK